MLTIKDTGRPIARLDNKKKQLLSIIDENKTKEIKMCCKKCNKKCEKKPCCEGCCVYYEMESESEDDANTEFHTNAELIALPDFTQRFIEYISGPSGSGKSTMAGKLATEFKNLNPKKRIYIFSRTDAKKDPAYKELNPIQIDINEELILNPIDITNEIDEKGCLMIFDDCGTIHNDKIRKEVEKLTCDAMEVGRKLNCNMIITNHLVIPNEKKFARTLLNEINMITLFPKSGSSQQMKYCLKTYWGMGNKQIEKILELKSRWVRISKTYPQYVLYEKGCFIL